MKYKKIDEDSKKYRVESMTTEGLFYEVDVEFNVCTCPGFKYNGKCKHIENLKKDLNEDWRKVFNTNPEKQEIKEVEEKVEPQTKNEASIYSLAISHLFKLVRLGDEEAMLRHMSWCEFRKIPDAVIATSLLKVIQEELSLDEAMKLIPVASAIVTDIARKKYSGWALWALAYETARAKKWYQCEETKKYIKIAVEGQGKVFKEYNVPLWVADKHTRLYWDRKKKGLEVDERMSGADSNCRNIVAKWEELKKEFPNYSFEELRKEWVKRHNEGRKIDLENENL